MYVNFWVAYDGTQHGFNLSWKDHKEQLGVVHILQKLFGACAMNTGQDPSQGKILRELERQLHELESLEQAIVATSTIDEQPSRSSFLTGAADSSMSSAAAQGKHPGSESDEDEVQPAPARSHGFSAGSTSHFVSELHSALQEARETGPLDIDMDEEAPRSSFLTGAAYSSMSSAATQGKHPGSESDEDEVQPAPARSHGCSAGSDSHSNFASELRSALHEAREIGPLDIDMDEEETLIAHAGCESALTGPAEALFLLEGVKLGDASSDVSGTDFNASAQLIQHAGSPDQIVHRTGLDRLCNSRSLPACLRRLESIVEGHEDAGEAEATTVGSQRPPPGPPPANRSPHGIRQLVRRASVDV